MTSPFSQRSRSVFTTILIPIILLILAEIALFFIVLGVNDVMGRINRNDNDLFTNQIETRKNYLQNYLVSTVADLSPLANVINQEAASLISEGKLSLDDLDNNVSSTAELQRRVASTMIDSLRSKRVSGVFAIFNTNDLSELSGLSLKMPGLFLNDMDPAATPSPRNEDLSLEHSAISLLNDLHIRTGINWSPLFNFQGRGHGRDFDFLSVPYQKSSTQAGSISAEELGYWSTSMLLDSEDGTSLCYTQPLVLSDGTTYGVVGVSLGSKYVQSLMPYRDFLLDKKGAYVLASVEDSAQLDELKLRPAIVSSIASYDGLLNDSLTLRPNADGGYSFMLKGQEYHANYAPLRLYNSNSPFDHERWVLLGIMPQSTLHSFSNQLLLSMLIAALAMSVAGIAGAIIVGHSISRPIRALSQEVNDARKQHRGMPELSRTHITEVDDLTEAISSLSQDIETVKDEEQKRLQHERDYDLLTGLMNRRSFSRQASELFAKPDTLKESALVMLDLDDLKKINDRYGHDWGDKYIYQAARLFEDIAPENALVVRVSGDEFYIFLYGHESRQEIEDWVELLKSSLEQAEFTLPGDMKEAIKASGGVAFYRKDATEFEELMKLADFAMTQVKGSGKGNISYFNIDNYRHQSLMQRTQHSFSELIHNHQLASYHYQPIFDAKTGAVFAYESLIRIALDALSSPADLFAIARIENRLLDLERITWTRALECYQALRTARAVEPDAYLFINSIASVSLEFDELSDIASHFPHIMRKVVIEITETEELDLDATSIKSRMPGFTGLFALDDYGSGYNSELKLLELKPTFVKVDISIIRDIDTSNDKQTVVRNIIEYAHDRNMQVVAEGIETPSELACLLDLNVDLLQGYYLARPSDVPAKINPVALRQIKRHRKASH